MANPQFEILNCDAALTHRFIDRARFAVVNRLRQPEGLSGFKSIPLIPQELERQAHLLPLLIDLNDAESLPNAKAELTEHLVARFPNEYFAEPSVLMLLETHEPPGRLGNHLQRHLVVRLPDATKALLRWYDPLVFVQLLHELGPAPLGSFFSGIEQIGFWLRGQWYTVSASPSTGLRKWIINSKTAARLADMAIINAVLAAVEWRTMETLQSLSQAIHDALERARSHHGLTARDDLTAFASHALRIHPQFDQHPRLQSLLEDLSKPKPEDDPDQQTYADATALLPDRVWQQIREELHSSRTTTS